MKEEDKIIIKNDSGLRCDNPECDFEDSSLKCTEENIGLPCPKCGETGKIKELKPGPDVNILIERISNLKDSVIRISG